MAELRIVGGQWRGRRIKVPAGQVRPTADRVREAWMSIVLQALDGAKVVDLCAGSGALGLEALSRGAASCDFVESSPSVRQVLAANIQQLGAEDRGKIVAGDALRAVSAGSRWDVAFADPPYGKGIAIDLAESWLGEPFATIFGVEHEKGISLPAYRDGSEPDRRVYGDTAITIYREQTS